MIDPPVFGMELIPPGYFKYEGRTVFVSWPRGQDNWHIWGPAEEITEGELVGVYTFADGSIRTVEVIEIIGERTARRRDGSRVRYVLATFDNIEDTKREQD